MLSILLKDTGKLSHAEAIEDIVVHLDDDGSPLFFEVLNASKIIPMMVQAIAKGRVVA